MSLPHPYPDLRESRLSWAPQIPSHWEIKRAKYLFNLERRAVRDEDGVVTAFRNGEVTLRSRRRTDGFTNSDKEIGYQGVRTGDLVIHAMDAFAGAVGVSDSDGKCTPVYSCCTPIGQVSVRFYAPMLRTMALTGFIESLSKGIRERSTDFRWRELAEQPIPVPPLDEQFAIAAFIQSENDRLERLIGRKLHFISLLREKINAEIVSSTAARDSWQRRPFWSLTSFKGASGLPDEGLLSVYLDRGVIPYSEGGGLVHKPAESLEKYQLVEPGDFVMNNQQAWRGSVGVSAYRGIVSPAYLVLGLDPAQIDSSFANYAFRSKNYVEHFRLASLGVGDIQRQIKWSLLRRISVCLPSLEEQRCIARKLDREKTRLDLLIAKTENSIELLKEHRIALIAAAVTGKIDVRDLITTSEVKDAA